MSINLLVSIVVRFRRQESEDAEPLASEFQTQVQNDANEAIPKTQRIKITRPSEDAEKKFIPTQMELMNRAGEMGDLLETEIAKRIHLVRTCKERLKKINKLESEIKDLRKEKEEAD